MNSLYLSPGEVISAYCAGSEKKFRSSALRLLLLGVLAGAIIAAAAAASNTAVYGISDTWTLRTICALLFPFGLGLVIVTGSELFTGNCMLPVALLDRRGTVGQMLRNWVLVYVGNFIGALFFVYVMIWCAGIVDADPWKSAIVQIAQTKTSLPWGVVFVKGIGANWLVCVAVWLGFSAHSTAGKMMGLWFPVMCFVAIGYEHSIANMFFIPLGMLQGASVTWGQFLLDNLVPATLGNIVGGALFVGCVYTYLYLSRK